MRVHVVSDVDGNVAGLARAAAGADALVVLGDLVNYVDYRDPRSGILASVLGPAASARFATLRSTGRPGELAAFARAAWSGCPDPDAVVADAVREQYAALFAAMTSASAPTFAIPGNVDLPALWPEFAQPGLCFPDGRVLRIGDLRFGFVGGIPLPPGMTPRKGGPFRPYVLTAEDHAAVVAGLGEVDVLCSHGPPAVPELAYDVVTRRPESPSRPLLDKIRTDRPRAALFGHVHQPLAARRRLAATECVNVGHFRQTGEPYVLRW